MYPTLIEWLRFHTMRHALYPKIQRYLRECCALTSHPYWLRWYIVRNLQRFRKRKWKVGWFDFDLTCQPCRICWLLKNANQKLFEHYVEKLMVMGTVLDKSHWMFMIWVPWVVQSFSFEGNGHKFASPSKISLLCKHSTIYVEILRKLHIRMVVFISEPPYVSVLQPDVANAGRSYQVHP